MVQRLPDAYRVIHPISFQQVSKYATGLIGTIDPGYIIPSLPFFHGNNEAIIPHPTFTPNPIFSIAVFYRNIRLVPPPHVTALHPQR